MANIFNLSAEKRERAGKGAARATRNAGRVPAVVYGDKKDPVMISLNPVELQKLIRTGGFYSTLVEINDGSDTHRVIARDIQLHPVTDRPLHVDFLRISKGAKMAVNVPVHFVNEESCPGLKAGGVLNIVRHEVELNVSPESIPEAIEFDLSSSEVGDSIHISAFALPDGVEPTITDRDFTVATIAAPTVAKASEETEEAEGEGEGEEAAQEEGGEE